MEHNQKARGAHFNPILRTIREVVFYEISFWIISLNNMYIVGAYYVQHSEKMDALMKATLPSEEGGHTREH